MNVGMTPRNDGIPLMRPISSLLSPRDCMCRVRKFHNAAKPRNVKGRHISSVLIMQLSCYDIVSLVFHFGTELK